MTLFPLKIKSIENMQEGGDWIKITFNDGSQLIQQHIQDCCEEVSIAQVDGDVSKHIGATAIELIEKSREATEEETSESGTWTFYTLKTSKGYLDWRWLGESNGYYSEDVECIYTKAA